MEKNQECSADHHSFTYIKNSEVGDERRTMNDKSSILNVDGSSPLEVVCGAPEHGGKFRKFQLVGFQNNTRIGPKSSANES